MKLLEDFFDDSKVAPPLCGVGAVEGWTRDEPTLQPLCHSWGHPRVVVVVVYNHRAEKATMTLQLFDFFVHLDTLTVDHSLLVLFSRGLHSLQMNHHKRFQWQPDLDILLASRIQHGLLSSCRCWGKISGSFNGVDGLTRCTVADTHWYRRAEGAIQVARREATGTGGRIDGCHGEWSIGRRMSWSFPELLSNRIKPKQSKKRCRFSLIL